MGLREGNVRVALGDVLHDKWTSGNVAGYSPNADPETSGNINVHFGKYNQEYGVPQIGLLNVSAELVERNWKPDGSGIVEGYDGRIDANVYVGAEDDLPQNSQLLAFAIGDEVRDIVHNTDRLVDSETSGLLTETIEPLSKPVVREDTDAPEARFLATVETGYRLTEQPDG